MKLLVFLVFTERIVFIFGQLLEISNAVIEQGDMFTVSCSVTTINKAITFKVENTAVGSCSQPFGSIVTCDNPDIQQNVSSGITSWTISSAEISYNGHWTCTLGTDPSPQVQLIIYKLPTTVLASSGIISNAVVNNTVSYTVTIEVGCLFSHNGPRINLQFMKATISKATISMTCTNSSTVCSTCTGCSAYDCNHNITLDDLKSGDMDKNVEYTLQTEVGVLGTTNSYTSPLFPGFTVTFISQSTDSCEFNYWNCIWYILATVYISSGICTLVVVVWWKTKRKEIKAKSIICWLAQHRFCCCGQHICCCCSQKIKSFCEKYQNTRIWGAPVLLLADVFVIGMVVSIVVWILALVVVIYTFCACIKDKFAVAGISLVLSLLASAIWTAIVLSVYLIASCCKNNGPGNRITKEAGDDINFLEQRSHEFKRIKSIDLTKDGTPVSPEEYEVKMTAVPSLILKMVSLEQSGKYKCTISYDLTKEEVHQLNLLVTPKQYEVKMGDRKTLLKCLRNLNGIEDVKWTLNNNAIPADSLFYKGGTKSNPSLTVKCCSTSDSGLYICSIRTTKGSKRFSAQLKTREKYTVGTGKSIEFLKDLSSCRDISLIYWELNGNPLELVDNPSYNGGTIESPVFTVNCATKEESGKYKCTLMLESLQTKELKFTLYLNEQLQVDSGESIALLDQLENSNNASSVEWTHKKRPLTCFHKGGTIECPALTIPVVSHEDSGEYNCKITLKQGNKRFYRFVVNVNVQKIKKKVGDRVVLLQNLKSAGTIQEIDWYKNGQKVQAGKDKKYQGGINQSPSLLVGSLQEHDSGLYECDLIVKESQIKLHILVDLTVEQKENSTRLGPVIGHNRVHNQENAENNQSCTEEEP